MVLLDHLKGCEGVNHLRGFDRPTVCILVWSRWYGDKPVQHSAQNTRGEWAASHARRKSDRRDQHKFELSRRPLSNPRKKQELRRTEDVDITSDGAGGYYVGWTQASEYLSYMVEVTEDGEGESERSFRLFFRPACWLPLSTRFVGFN